MSEVSKTPSLETKNPADTEKRKFRWKNLLQKLSVGRKAEVEPTETNEYLQILGQKPLDSLDEMLGLPEDTNEDLGATAVVWANDYMDGETEERLRFLNINGNSIGIGGAGIFVMLEAFKVCRSFTSIDIHPTPVAVGRIMSHLFLEQKQFEDFLVALSNENDVKESLVSAGLPEKYINSAVEIIKKAVQQYNDARNPKATGTAIEGLHVRLRDRKNLLPLEAIRIHYAQLKDLAQRGKLNFIQADFFWPGFWTDMERNVPEMKTANNLIFLTNGLDHVVRSKALLWNKWQSVGKDYLIKEQQKALGTVIADNFAGWDHSKFVFTLTSLDYELKLVDKPPIFMFNEQGDLVVQS